tara:strand:- start:677 stop:973 length:297 start_codon:yes stop_codon:yes gene_type:complete
MLFEYIIFGIVDNAVMLSSALFGVSIEKKLPKKLQSGFLGATLGAGIGNAFSDFLGGLGATNIELALGSGLGCLIALVILPVYLAIKKEVKNEHEVNN